MDIISLIMVVFAVLGAIDFIIGNRFGIGKEFEKGFMLLGTMALTMIGMIVLAPFIGDVLRPVFDWFYTATKIDPSILPVMIFAGDMGGAPLASEISKAEVVGYFNGLVISSMMGCTICFTVPVVLKIVGKSRHSEVILGLLCGIVTIPIGCFISGLVVGINALSLLYNMLPLIIFCIILAIGLVFIPKICIKIFSILGYGINVMIIIGLMLAVIEYMLGIKTLPNIKSVQEAGEVCLNAAMVMAGAFPLMNILSRILQKPLSKLGHALDIGNNGALGLMASLATSMTTFPMMNEMNKKGIVLNSAFMVSAGYTFAGHLAFALAYNKDFVVPMIIGKLISGFAGLILSVFIYRRQQKGEPTNEN